MFYLENDLVSGVFMCGWVEFLELFCVNVVNVVDNVCFVVEL